MELKRQFDEEQRVQEEKVIKLKNSERKNDERLEAAS
jgi:hypothetical protein